MISMLLSESFTLLKISDFGLKTRRPTDIFQKENYKYWAPELFIDLNNDSSSTDVYGFAISIWEILTKRAPYDDTPTTVDSFASFGEHIKKFRPPLESIPDPEICNILEIAWNSDPSLRPTMNEIITFFEDNKVKDFAISDKKACVPNFSNCSCSISRKTELLRNPSDTAVSRSRKRNAQSFMDEKSDQELMRKRIPQNSFDNHSVCDSIAEVMECVKILGSEVRSLKKDVKDLRRENHVLRKKNAKFAEELKYIKKMRFNVDA